MISDRNLKIYRARDSWYLTKKFGVGNVIVFSSTPMSKTKEYDVVAESTCYEYNLGMELIYPPCWNRRFGGSVDALGRFVENRPATLPTISSQQTIQIFQMLLPLASQAVDASCRDKQHGLSLAIHANLNSGLAGSGWKYKKKAKNVKTTLLSATQTVSVSPFDQMLSGPSCMNEVD